MVSSDEESMRMLVFTNGGQPEEAHLHVYHDQQA